VDWAALKETDITKSTPVSLSWRPPTGMKLPVPSKTPVSKKDIPSIEKGLWRILWRATDQGSRDATLEYLVDGEVVFISTRTEIDRRMAARNREDRKRD